MKYILITFLWLYAGIAACESRLNIAPSPTIAERSGLVPDVGGAIMRGQQQALELRALQRRGRLESRLMELQEVVGQYGLQSEKGKAAMQEWRMIIEASKALKY